MRCLQVVGATGTGGGLAFVYLNNAVTGVWSLTTTLSAFSGGGAGDSFATSLSIFRELSTGYDALILVAGAPAVSSAYVFFYNPVDKVWVDNVALKSSEPGDDFGYSVANYEDLIAVGSPASANAMGGVTTYVGEQNGTSIVWTIQSKVRA